MIVVFAILVFVVYLSFFYPMEPRVKKTEEKSPKYVAQMKKLWQIAQTAMKERKPFRAEKALLTILKFDEKNAAAYNRLGILYAKEQRFDEAVECFEIAQSLDNNPASIHNAGLIYLEIGAYEKAALAFQQAIDLEGDVPTRYIALAKADEKLGRTRKSIEALENAYSLDPKVSTLRQILSLYEDLNDAEAVTAMAARIEEQITRDNKAKLKKTATRTTRSTARTATRSTTRRVAPVRRATTTRRATSRAATSRATTPRTTTSKATTTPTRRITATKATPVRRTATPRATATRTPVRRTTSATPVRSTTATPKKRVVRRKKVI